MCALEALMPSALNATSNNLLHTVQTSDLAVEQTKNDNCDDSLCDMRAA